MSFLELKVPPVVVALVCAGLTWVLSRTGPALPVSSAALTIASILLAAAGIAIAAAGVMEFLKANTTVNPHRPKHTSALVTSGIYR